jgi:tetratricopeptide (TPR) repeat protein
MTLCPPVNTPLEFFLGSSRDQRTAPTTPDCDAVASHPPSVSKVAIGEAVSVLERHALVDVDGDQLGMHQLMALAVRAELEAEAPGSCAGVHDLQALLTARYGTEEDDEVDAEEYKGMREVGDAAEYAVTAAIEAVGGADVQLQRWACGMYLRLAKVQVVVTSDTRNCERLLAGAKACLQRLQGQGCTGLRELDWRMQNYRADVPEMKGDYDEALSMLQRVESEFADCTNAALMGYTLHNIGNALNSKGEYDKAVEYYTRALVIRMEKSGPRHPHVAT